MALVKQKFHEVVLQMLFCCDYSCTEEPQIIAFMMEQLKITKKTAKEAYKKVQSILERIETLDQRIKNVSKEYQFKRISQVEKTVLRLGLFELDAGEPCKAVIVEAVRLCRKFGTSSGARFVHAILDLCSSKNASNPANP